MDKINQSKPSGYLRILKSALPHTHKNLDAFFSWPVPYWLSPLGIFIFWAAWEGLNWKVNSDSWPIWVWFLDKSITIGAIFGAALLAQKIFNENARIREDRERRLKRVEKAIEISNQLRTIGRTFLNSNFEDYNENYAKLMDGIVFVRTFSNVYFPDKTNISELYNAVHKIHKEQPGRENEYDFEKPSLVQGMILDNNDDGMPLYRLIARLITKLVKVHKEIENEH